MRSYRPDIDGLRALAVVPVVLFHADVPGFSGGFVGVDVFFVISGFLITSIIRQEMVEGRFSIIGFYERRARRILPALFVVMAACVPLSAMLLFPEQYESFATSLIAASLFVASFHFRMESGYFDLAATEKPLLHTWSLSVEEIFYVFFPLLLLFMARRQNRTVLIVLISLAALSFLASVAALYNDPASRTAFFLPPFRAWELLAGSLLVFLNPERKLPLALLQTTALIGLAFIVWPVVTYSENTVFPGLAAVLPCLGTVLIIFSGSHAKTVVSRGLSLPAMVFVGLISYSLYLWHWPLFVFAKAYSQTALGALQVAGLIGLSVALAFVSWRVVERPFRNRTALPTRRQVFTAAAGATTVFLVIGMHGISTNGWITRFAPELRAILTASHDVDPRQSECLSSDPRVNGCRYGAENAISRVALWGDSHGAVYAQALGELAEQSGQSVDIYTMPSCPPVVGWTAPNQPWRANCEVFQSYALETLLNSEDIEFVLLSGRFPGYPIANRETGFPDALIETIDQLKSAGKQVALVYPVPEFGGHVPNILGEMVRRSDLSEALTTSRIRQTELFAEEEDVLDELVAAHQLIAIRPQDALCDETLCYFSREGAVYYSDEIHLSLTGARQTQRLFTFLFESTNTN